MTEFLRSLVLAAAFLSLAVLFIPEKAGIRKASLSALSLLFLLLLFPKDGSFSLEALLPGEDVPAPPNAGYSEILKEAVEEGIRKDLVERFSLNANAVQIKTDLTASEAGLLGSYLRLSLGRENFFADAGAILRYVEATYGVDCEVNFFGS